MDFKEIESRFQPTRNCKCAEAEHGMVATAFPDATRAGARMLMELEVCEPQSSGIGGQTMMLITSGGGVLAIDGSSRAPAFIENVHQLGFSLFERCRLSF